MHFVYRGYLVVRMADSKDEIYWEISQGGEEVDQQPTKDAAREAIDQWLDAR